MPKWLRVSFVVALVIVGLVLPSIPPAGRSLLVWVQRTVLGLSATNDMWREEQKPVEGGKSNGTGASGPAGKSTAAQGCREGEDLLATVPYRDHYQLLADCVTVTGTVRSEPHVDPDGVQFTFDVDAPDSHLFAPQASDIETGQTHQISKPVVGFGIVVPADLPGCRPGEVVKRGHFDAKAVGLCSGLDIIVPAPGTRVKVTGAFVFDRESKLHVVCPVWSITPLYD